jgi:hypothetical protein
MAIELMHEGKQSAKMPLQQYPGQISVAHYHNDWRSNYLIACFNSTASSVAEDRFPRHASEGRLYPPRPRR